MHCIAFFDMVKLNLTHLEWICLLNMLIICWEYFRYDLWYDLCVFKYVCIYICSDTLDPGSPAVRSAALVKLHVLCLLFCFLSDHWSTLAVKLYLLGFIHAVLLEREKFQSNMREDSELHSQTRVPPDVLWYIQYRRRLRREHLVYFSTETEMLVSNVQTENNSKLYDI